MEDQVQPEQKLFTKRGLHNWRNLFRKPNGYEWTILFLLFMACFIGLRYKTETAMCRETLNNIEQISCKVCSEHLKIDQIQKEIGQKQLAESSQAVGWLSSASLSNSTENQTNAAT